MKIVQVLDSFFPDSIGGTENYVYHVSHAMLSLGHDVCIVAAKKGCTEDYDIDGLHVRRFPIAQTATKQELIEVVPPKGINEFLDIIKDFRPDIVHFNTFNRAINSYHLKAVHDIGIKTVFTAHQSGIFCLKGTMLNGKGERCDGNVHSHDCLRCYLTHQHGKLRAQFISAAAKGASITRLLSTNVLPASFYLKQNRIKELNAIKRYSDSNVAISKWVNTCYLLNGVENVVLIKQGINPSFIENSREDTISTSERLHLLFVGRIYPIKGLDVFCKALDKVDKDKVEVTFACVCGEDKYAQEVKKYIYSLPHFKWYENLKPEAIASLMRQNDLLVLPSQSEMSPLVVLEAFACRLPVLGSDIPPITDNVIDGINGLTFKVNDTESLASAINSVLSNSQKIKEFRNNIKAVRTLNDVASELIDVYRSILNK